MKRDEWVATLKAGDEVAVRANYGREPSIYKVASVTPGGRVRVHIGGRLPAEFNPDGRQRGSSGYDMVRIEPVTDAIREEALRAGWVARLRATD